MSSINQTPQEKLQAIADGLKQYYPDAGISFGYIGNVSLRYGDDRNWYIFTELVDDKGKDIKFGGYETKSLSNFLIAANDNIVRWGAKIKKILESELADKDNLAAGKSVQYRRYRK